MTFIFGFSSSSQDESVKLEKGPPTAALLLF